MFYNLVLQKLPSHKLTIFLQDLCEFEYALSQATQAHLDAYLVPGLGLYVYNPQTQFINIYLSNRVKRIAKSQLWKML